MDVTIAEKLRARQVDVYRSMGWRIEREEGSEAEAIGPSGARWFILGADAARLADPAFGERIEELGELRLESGEGTRRCLVDVVTVEDCEADAARLLGRLGLSESAHVNLYVAA